MKALKNLVSIVFLLCLFACTEDSVTKFSKYNKDTIQSDSNWVEVTEIDTIYDLCFAAEDVLNGVVCRTLNDYRTYYDLIQSRISTRKQKLSQEQRNEMGPCYKYDSLIPPDIDFNNRDLILYGMNSGFADYERKLYYNSQTEEYLYLLKISEHYTIRDNDTMHHFALMWYYDAITLPKLTRIDQIRFDTLMFKKYINE